MRVIIVEASSCALEGFFDDHDHAVPSQPSTELDEMVGKTSLPIFECGIFAQQELYAEIQLVQDATGSIAERKVAVLFSVHQSVPAWCVYSHDSSSALSACPFRSRYARVLATMSPREAQRRLMMAKQRRIENHLQLKMKPEETSQIIND